MPLKEAQIGFIFLYPVIGVCSKCLFKSKHGFYYCYEECRSLENESFNSLFRK